MVPFRRNPKFVGRQKEIEHLRALISDPNGPRELAITGLGGVGKTQVALEVAYQIRDDDPDWSIFWIPCTSMESIEQAYTEMAQRLGLSGGNNAKKEVQTYLSQSTSGNWLLIFDNADDENIWFTNDNALQAFIAENEHGRTLFTSRNQQLAVDLTDSNVVPLPEYDINTGLEFLQQSLQKNDLLKDHDTAVQFLEQLMLLPLAITQAVAYINKNQITLPTYIRLLERQESDIIEVLSEDFKDKWRYKDVQNPVATTWWISFQQIQQSSQLAAEYLTFMACINPRNIPQCMLPPSNSENDKIKAIGLLKSYAFVSDCEPGQYGLLSIHRLVHI
jgi:Cdc6-like AAA superfamily ATPase